jgi:hypothetical protein
MKRLLILVVVLAFAMPCLAQTAQPPKPGAGGPETGLLRRDVEDRG